MVLQNNGDSNPFLLFENNPISRSVVYPPVSLAGADLGVVEDGRIPKSPVVNRHPTII
jgi:hypothetical protein